MSTIMNKQTIGWLQAFLAVLVFLGICNVFGRYSIVVHNTNPFIYSCVAFSSAAFALLIYAGKGPLGKETMRSIDTWVYGLVLMGGYVIGMLLFAYVTSTEGTILQKVSVFLSIFASWVFLGRKPDSYQFLGLCIIMTGVGFVFMGLDKATIGIVALLALSYGGLQAARIFTAELHRPHSTAAKRNDPHARARVISFVMFTMSCIFTVFCLCMCSVQHLQGERFSEFLPIFSDFTYPPNIFLGIIMGVLIVVPLRILEFSSAYTIKAANFTTVTAFSSLGTMFWEWATSPLTGLSMKALSHYDMIAGGLITLGAFTIAITRPIVAKQGSKLFNHLQESHQNPQAVEDSRDILAETLEHFSGNIKKSSQALGLPQHAVKALMGDNMRKLSFANIGDVQRMFRQNVAGQDALTGLLNRNAFKRLSAELLDTCKACTLLYIDLDKFKPINDTYGHDAGDAILMETASRMKKQLPEGSLVCRMGGDEFCALLPLKATKAKHITPLQKAIQAPITIQDISDTLSVGASIGIAHHPKDGETLEELISHADEGMYGVKHSRGS